ncbi:cucumber peeling cupredoxin-like [Benincasa hispida]|uniref:cucumber peeling cupredoxin-like n=1 Tax=Benincasa hispida TaxID=102211 RepID=UPI0019026487|nr:cucumber peeling cupredoxin-like [Benincasa hispida]
MAAKSMFAAVFLLLVVVAPLRRTAAATHNVGDSLGWTIPSSPSTYSDWASTKTFLVGDILFFNFTTGQHDVTEVTKAALDSCSSTNPISAVRSGPANITLSAAGTRHFICSFPTHCSLGQKLTVTVRSQSSSPPTTAPSPSPKSSSPVSPTPSPHSSRPPKASPPTATSPPETAPTPPSNIAPTPPPPNSANSFAGFGLSLSAGLAIVVALIY